MRVGAGRLSVERDPVTDWADDFAVPFWAKPVIRRAIRRADRDLRTARAAATSEKDLCERVVAVGRGLAGSVNRTERVRGWVETVNREDLFEALAELVRRSLAGYRGDLEVLVAAGAQGMEDVRDW